MTSMPPPLSIDVVAGMLSSILTQSALSVSFRSFSKVWLFSVAVSCLPSLLLLSISSPFKLSSSYFFIIIDACKSFDIQNSMYSLSSVVFIGWQHCQMISGLRFSSRLFLLLGSSPTSSYISPSYSELSFESSDIYFVATISSQFIYSVRKS